MRTPLDQRSFRDPDGITLDSGDAFYRLLNASGRETLNIYTQSKAIGSFIDSGRMIAVQELDDHEKEHVLSGTGGHWADAVKHPRLPFVSYPHEWPAQMLHAAATLTLDIAAALHEEGLMLKDATPYNVGFRHGAPVFLDVLSVETRAPDVPIWRAEAQFVRQFLLPLMCEKYFNLPAHMLLAQGPDTVTPERVFNLAGPLRRLLPPFLWWVSLPVWLSKSAKAEDAATGTLTKPPEMSAFIVSRTLRRLRKALARVAPAKTGTSAWSDYEETRLYKPAELRAKSEFVAAAIERVENGTVLDLGCNAGEFSCQAAKAGHHVVAIDADPVAAGMAWERAVAEAATVEVICADAARPTPAMGFNNSEWDSLLSRLNGKFDIVFALGISHHLMVTAGIPIDHLVDMLASLTRRFVAIEFVGAADPNFRRIARGRDALHEGVDAAAFRAAAARRFRVCDEIEIVAGCRTGFILEKSAEPG